MSRSGTFLGLISLLLFSSVARAGEADDLQRMIDNARQVSKDLESLDDQKSAHDEITLMRSWVDVAWRLRADQKYDEVRQVLDRVDAQRDMIREKIAAAKASAEAARKESELKRLRDSIAKTKEAIQAATLQKAAVEAKVK
jgi:hypothetical protein